MSKARRFFGILLAVMMIVVSIQLPVYADEGDQEQNPPAPAEEQTETTDPAEDPAAEQEEEEAAELPAAEGGEPEAEQSEIPGEEADQADETPTPEPSEEPAEEETEAPDETPSPEPVGETDTAEESENEPAEENTEEPEPVPPEEPAEEPAEEPTEEPAEEPSEEPTEEPTEEPAPEPVPFEQSKTINGVVITVKAEAGAFPVGSELYVAQVPVYKQAKVEEAVEEEREADANVAVSYTFDIQVRDPEGQEIQPAEGYTVNVSFSLAEVADQNLDTAVYHVTEEGNDLTAEKLDITEESGGTATVETDGFSLYQVEFTYNTLEYVLQGNESVLLSEILTAVGLSGTATAVEVSDPELFSASNESGEWMVTAHQAFDTEEWMKVVISGIEYRITVTDDNDDITTWAELQERINGAENGAAIILTQDLKAESTDGPLEIPASKTLTIDLKGFSIDRNLTSQKANGYVMKMNAGSSLTITDSSAKKTGKITGGKNASEYGGIYACGTEANRCTLTLQGGSITQNTCYVGARCGGGIYARYCDITISGGNITYNTSGICLTDGSTCVMNSGSITDNSTSSTAAYGAGVFIDDSCRFTLNGGTVSNNKTTVLGGGFYVNGTLKITGGTVTKNTAQQGGGIYNVGTVEMTGGSIKENHASYYNNGTGGGIYCYGDGNTTGSTFEMKGGSITGNTAVKESGGLYVRYPAIVKLSGNINISGNYQPVTPQIDDNLHMHGGYLNINGALSDNARICVTREPLTSLTFPYPLTQTAAGVTVSPANFTCDTDGYLCITHNGEVALQKGLTITFDSAGGSTVKTQTVLSGDTATEPVAPTKRKYHFGGWYQVMDTSIGTVSDTPFDFSTAITANTVLKAKWLTDWAWLQKQIDDAGNNSTITLDQNIVATAEDTKAIQIESGKKITLDLNGYSLNRNLTSEANPGSSVIAVHGDLTIKDTKGTGTITGGYQTGSSGGIYAGGRGTKLTLESGSITGNGTSGIGGGIYVCQNAEFTMTGGNISNNEAGASGGGIYVAEAVVSIRGGSITGNNAVEQGGGIYKGSSGSLNLSGDPEISGNTVGTMENSNIALITGTATTPVTITVDKALDPETPISVLSDKVPTKDSPVVITGALGTYATVAGFASENADYGIGLKDGAAVLSVPYTVLYDPDNGSAVSDQSAYYGLTVAAPSGNPEKTGYTLAGWYALDGSGEMDSTAFDFTAGITSDTTVRAKWTANTYTIRYNSNGATAGAMADQAFTYDTEQKLKANAFTRTGATFAGWNTAANGSGTAYSDQQSVKNLTAEDGAVITLYAQWTKKGEYIINFDPDGGSAVTPIKGQAGSAVKAPANPTRTGYTFTGWSPALPSTMPEQNLTLKAQWKANNYTITFVNEDGSVLQTITAAYGTAVTAPADPKRDNYVFNGWSRAVPAVMPAENIRITASWLDNVEAFVTRLYRIVLGRNPDPNGLREWTAVLKNQSVSAAQVVAGFMNSDEYQKKHLSAADIVENLYFTMMDRKSDAAGKQSWINAVNAGTDMNGLINGFAQSDEFKALSARFGITAGTVSGTGTSLGRSGAGTPSGPAGEGITGFVSRCYQVALGRDPDPNGLQEWAATLINKQATPKQVAYGFVFSPEMTGKNLSNEEYVKALYRLYMGRESDPNGLREWVYALNHGATREQVNNGFADSIEFAGIVASFGL